MAVASLHAGTRNVRPQASALICCHTALRAPPPSEYTVSAGQPRRSACRKSPAAETRRIPSRCGRNGPAWWKAARRRIRRGLRDRRRDPRCRIKNGRNASPSHPQGTLCTSASSACISRCSCGKVAAEFVPEPALTPCPPCCRWAGTGTCPAMRGGKTVTWCPLRNMGASCAGGHYQRGTRGFGDGARRACSLRQARRRSGHCARNDGDVRWQAQFGGRAGQQRACGRAAFQQFGQQFRRRAGGGKAAVPQPVAVKVEPAGGGLQGFFHLRTGRSANGADSPPAAEAYAHGQRYPVRVLRSQSSFASGSAPVTSGRPVVL